MLTRSTTALPSDGRTCRTFPRAPRSRPWMTSISSFLRIFTLAISEDLRRQRDDPHEAPLAQLTGHRPEDAGAHRLSRIVDQYRRIAVETDIAAVAAPVRTAGAYDHRLHHRPLLHRAVGRRFLDRRGDDVAEAPILPGRAAPQVDASDLLGAG